MLIARTILTNTELGGRLAERMKAESWSMLSEVRYALVTPAEQTVVSSKKRFHVVDVPSYLRQVLGNRPSDKAEMNQLIQYWEQRFANIDSSFYDEEDIHDILDKMYPIEGSAAEK